jgi:hypothetical protein
MDTVTESKPASVYQCIAAVSAALAKSGIAKDRKNEQQHYSFRGIDDVYNALSPAMTAHGLVIIPRILDRDVVERQTKSGGALFYVTVRAAFDFVAAADGSMVTVYTFGEAMDSGDKATNKAMSAAYKYAAMQTFCIPTEGDNDADKVTHEVAAKKPDGYEDWVLDQETAASFGFDALAAAFKASKPAFRDYRLKHENQQHESLKAKAKAVVAKPELVAAS